MTHQTELETNSILHITSGDICGASLAKAGLPGEVFVWHDILYDGIRTPGWPNQADIEKRAAFFEQITAGELHKDRVLHIIQNQYRKLEQARKFANIVLWFDACLFDQTMLSHILTCLLHLDIYNTELICVDSFPGIVPFHGLGQLKPNQMASLYAIRLPVTREQFLFAKSVDEAFAKQNADLIKQLATMEQAPLPCVPAVATRWLKELPDPSTGLTHLEKLALNAIHSGCDTPIRIFAAVSAADAPPQYWTDMTLWSKINSLASSTPPLIHIDGPAPLLPQWESMIPIDAFKITPVMQNQ